MITNESEGLAKLTEYLKQTRRQAEIAIDNLNSQLSHVSNENEELRQAMKQLEQEKAEYKRLLEQLKQESSSKNKFKERDDWKCLVDSIQQDRTRLQEENNQLQAFLSTASQQIEGLKQEMEKLNDEKLELEDINKKLQFQIDELEKERQNGVSEEKGSSTREKLLIRTHSNSIDNGPNGLMETSPKSFISPVVDKSSGRQIFSFDTTSPHAIAKKLKDELLKAHAQVSNNFHGFDIYSYWS
jgi:chromosome segregation ATPase